MPHRQKLLFRVLWLSPRWNDPLVVHYLDRMNQRWSVFFVHQVGSRPCSTKAASALQMKSFTPGKFFPTRRTSAIELAERGATSNPKLPRTARRTRAQLFVTQFNLETLYTFEFAVGLQPIEKSLRCQPPAPHH